MNVRESNLLRSSGYKIDNPEVEIVFGNILAINENFYIRKSGDFLEKSNDYGVSYTSSLNVSGVGDLRFIHVFTNGSLLVCGRKKAFYSSDWVNLNESTIKDINGNNWVAQLNNDNLMSLHGLEVQKVAGNEIAVWGNYNNDQNANQNNNAISECFYTRDFGKTIKVFFKSGVSSASGWVGVIRCRHIHHIQQNPNDESFWIQTGDEPTETMSHWIRCVYDWNLDSWIFNHIGSGNHFKTTYLKFFKGYIYYALDIANGGLWKCKVEEAGDVSKHLEVKRVGTDLGGFIMGKNGDVALVVTKYFNPSYLGRLITYSKDQINWVTVYGDMPSDANQNSIYGRLFQPNSRGEALASIQYSYSQPMYLYNFMPSVFINDILRKNGYPDAFK